MSAALHTFLPRSEALPFQFGAADIRRETVRIAMRDGMHLATDLYMPPVPSAPAIAMRTPYGRAAAKYVDVFLRLARCGYAVVAQDCRGTGDSEPDHWDYYVYESEDGVDLVDWIVRQSWCDGFVAGCGGSYAGQTQWCMATHPRMSAIAPEVSGLGIARNTARLYMFLNAFARSIGKGADQVPAPLAELERSMLVETLAGGYFNEPLHEPLPQALLALHPPLEHMAPHSAHRWLWEHYCRLTCAQRAAFVKQAMKTERVSIVEVESLSRLFGQDIAHDAHTLPHLSPAEACRDLRAPALLVTGWYDWGLNDALATWEALQRESPASVRERSRLFITPGAHNQAGYREDIGAHPGIERVYRTEHIVPLLHAWYEAVRTEDFADWPRVVYYLMGATEWRAADAWPPKDAQPFALYLAADGQLTTHRPSTESSSDSYLYDPLDPTPTVGGSILSYVYPPGSVDVSKVQARADVLTYTSLPLRQDLDMVGPLKFVLHASSSALDTDFVARLSDVFPDGRAIQMQNGLLRARHRDPSGPARWLEPERVYEFEIDLWATANRFSAGHRIRIDISSADFPRYDRNSNRGGVSLAPVPAQQRVYRDGLHPSHLIACALSAVEFEPGEYT